MFFRRRRSNEPTDPAPRPGATTPSAPARLSPRSPSEALKPTAAPPPPQRPSRRERGGLLSTISGVLTLLVVVALGVIMAVVVLDRRASEPGPLAGDKVVLVPARSGVSEIAAVLAREGVIAEPWAFELAARLGRKGGLKAGEYLFKAGISIDDALDVLVQGRQVQHAVTLPEGLTSEQIVARLYENEVLSGEVNETPREGALLPDTYKFERGATRQQIVNLMQAKQREVLAQIWARRSPEVPVRSPGDLVTLASIVEKETGRADERPRVAGVFVNRLKSRMKLQSDPTIVYGLVGGKGTLGRGILRSEIERATPYNTYAIEGLPPGPIANPGRAAMEAVANPSRTKDLYFVADGTGGHSFAETYEQHIRNVGRWRQIERAKPASDPNAGGVDRIEAAPDAPVPGAGVPPRASAYAPGSEASAGPEGRPRAFDASEGTPRDPLRNRTFDLNSPKSVPQLRQP